MREVKTRRQAAEDGDHKYFTGRPCVHGHLGPRYTASGVCCACNVAAAAKYNKHLKQKTAARLQGHFSYPLHPDDHAAALAYCQALDIQRGRMPSSPAPVAPPSPFDADAARRLAFGKSVALAGAGAPLYLPEP